MNIFKAEYDVPGLAEKMQANSSVAYYAPAQKYQLSEKSIANLQLATAGKKISFANDMYTTKSILVSTVWNLNDDVFVLEDTWAARNTPVHKFTNLGHDEHEIVGHMVETWAIDNEGNEIPDDISVDDLPALYHICDAAVIWTTYNDQALIDRTQALIENIEAGNMFVSMECLFPNFDYAAVTSEGFNLIPRNQSTAFLTKHLRAYGGEGHYQGNKIGRVLRGFSFSGKGYVEQPGNPQSIIFEEGHQFDFSKAEIQNPFDETSGVHILCKGENSSNENQSNEVDNQMAELNEVLQGRLDKAEASNADKDATIADLQKQLSESAVASVQEENKSLKDEVTAAMEKFEAESKKAEEAQASVADLTKKLEEAEAAKAELEEKIAKVEAEKVTAGRVSTLVDGGIDKAEAEVTVAKFDNLNDEQFEAVATTLIEAAKAKFPPKDDEEKDKDKKDAKASEEEVDSAESNADESNLDNAEAEDKGAEGAANASVNEEEENVGEQLSKSLACLINKNRK